MHLLRILLRLQEGHAAQISEKGTAPVLLFRKLNRANNVGESMLSLRCELLQHRKILILAVGPLQVNMTGLEALGLILAGLARISGHSIHLRNSSVFTRPD